MFAFVVILSSFLLYVLKENYPNPDPTHSWILDQSVPLIKQNTALWPDFIFFFFGRKVWSRDNRQSGHPAHL